MKLAVHDKESPSLAQLLAGSLLNHLYFTLLVVLCVGTTHFKGIH